MTKYKIITKKTKKEITVQNQLKDKLNNHVQNDQNETQNN